MMNSNDFCNILTDGLSSDQKIRSAAEQRIKTLATNNFGMFLLLCADELTNESKNAKNRQLAATLIKNMILSMPEFVGKWEQLPVMEKTNVKARVLSTLASQDKDIRKAAALVVASNKLLIF
jgi:importin subunit beta-1